MEIKREARKYLTSDDVDQLARQNTQLMTELWIVKDRLAVLENLLAEKGILAADEVDGAVPDEALGAKLDRERERFIQRIVGIPPEERTIERLKALGTK
jgi:hypothetical protein